MIRLFIALLWLVLAIVPVSAQVGLTGAGGVKKASVGGGGTLTYTPTDVAQANNTGSGTFTGVSIGAVAADRIIVVTMAIGSNAYANGTPSSVTVGGVSMTQAVIVPSGSGNVLAIYYLAAPAGVLNATTATVQINTPFSTSYGIAVGTLTGSASATVNATSSDAWSGGGTVADPRGVTNDLAAVAVASGGVVVTGWGIDRTITATVNSANTTIDMHAAVGLPDFVQAHGTNGSPNFNGATNFNCAFVIASFRP